MGDAFFGKIDVASGVQEGKKWKKVWLVALLCLFCVIWHQRNQSF